MSSKSNKKIWWYLILLILTPVIGVSQELEVIDSFMLKNTFSILFDTENDNIIYGGTHDGEFIIHHLYPNEKDTLIQFAKPVTQITTSTDYLVVTTVDKIYIHQKNTFSLIGRV